MAQENRGFLAQQGVETLLDGLIVMEKRQPPLSRGLVRSDW